MNALQSIDPLALFLFIGVGNAVFGLLLLGVLSCLILFIVSLITRRRPSKQMIIITVIACVLFGSVLLLVSYAYRSDRSPFVTPTAEVDACHTNNLSASTAPGVNGPTSRSYELYVTNTSAQACFVEGYPTVLLVNSKGMQLGSDATHDDSYPVSRLTLRSNERAKIILTVTYNAGQPCQLGVYATSLSLDTQSQPIVTQTDIAAACPQFTTTAFKAP